MSPKKPQISGHVGDGNPSIFSPYFRRLVVGKQLQSWVYICNMIYIYISLYILYIHMICISYIIHHIYHTHIYIAITCLHILLHIFVSKLIEKTKTFIPIFTKGPTAPPPNQQPVCLRVCDTCDGTGAKPGAGPTCEEGREGMVREDDPFFIHDCCTTNLFSRSRKTAEFRHLVLWLFDISRRKPWLQIHEV